LKSVKETGAAADFQWRNLTVGYDIDAVRFAVKNKTFILLNGHPSIHSYDVDPAGCNLEEEWAKKSVQLYDLGLNPFGDRIKTLRFDTKKKRVKVFTASSKYEILYEHLTVFNLQNVFGLECDFNETLVGYRVLDWFDIKKSADISIDLLEDSTSNFVKKIQLFPSTRRDGAHASKDLVSESFLSREQLNSIDYSDTMARFKTMKMLSSRGVSGVELELWKRDVLPIFTLDDC